MASEDDLRPDVVQSDREAIARALKKGQQLGWQKSGLSWILRKGTPDPSWVVDEALGQIELEPWDVVPWVVTLKPWFRDPNVITPNLPVFGKVVTDFLRARVIYGGGSMGPNTMLVDWPGPGTSFMVNGQNVKLEVVGQWTGAAADPLTVINTEAPQSFGAFVMPARDSKPDSFQAPTFTDVVTATLAASPGTLTMPIPLRATAIEVHAFWPQVTELQVTMVDDPVAVRRLTQHGYRAAGAAQNQIGNFGQQAPRRLPYWARTLQIPFAVTADTNIFVMFHLTP